jgi:MoxR-like ATPase
MDQAIDEMMIAVFSRGHCLLVGVPGLAKTLLVSSLAQTCRWCSSGSSSRPT